MILDDLLEAALDIPGRLIGGPFSGKRPASGALTEHQRLVLSKVWRDWGMDRTLRFPPDAEHLAGEAHGFGIEIHRRFFGAEPMRIVVHAKGPIGVAWPVRFERGKAPPPNASAIEAAFATRLFERTDTLVDVHLEEGLAMFRLVPRATPDGVDDVLIELGAFARKTTERPYR